MVSSEAAEWETQPLYILRKKKRDSGSRFSYAGILKGEIMADE
jgi:hypothetical protein